jgi:hypothetical protein
VMKPVYADPGLAGVEQEQRLKPHVKRHVRAFQHSPDLDVEGLAAGIAFIGADLRRLSPQAPDPRPAFAMRTDGTVRPDLALNILVGSLFALEGGLIEDKHNLLPF